MIRERKEDLSVYYWLKDLFPTFTIVDGFPVENLKIPTISVEVDTIDSEPFELGNRHRQKFRVWYIDVFAATKSQRDEVAYKILEELENPIQVYDYDEGFPPSVSPSNIGGLIPQDIRLEIKRVLPELVDLLYYRSTVTFSAVYNQI